MFTHRRTESPPNTLLIEGARQNNLKNISLQIPHNALTVITGVSGSGKSSLAFETLFAEGQWRYVESLSTYARLFIEKVNRPDVDQVVNIRPAIAIEQKNPVRTARSTVGTATEVADLLRLVFAKIGRPVCPDCHEEARSYQPADVAADLLHRFPAGRAMILFPIGAAQTEDIGRTLLTRGYLRLVCQDDIITLTPETSLTARQRQDAQVVVDRLVIQSDARPRLVEAIETAFHEGHGLCRVDVIGHGRQTYSRQFGCQRCGKAFPPLRPILFSFNHPLAACPECHGFGNVLRYDEDLVVPNKHRSLAEGAIEPWTKPGTESWQKDMLLALKRRGVDLATPYAKLSDEQRAWLWNGDRRFEGINQFFRGLEQKRYKLHVRVFLSRYRSPFPCPTCRGARLKPEALFVKVAGRDIHEVSNLTIDQATEWLESLRLSAFDQEVVQEVQRQLTAKLGFLRRVGLGYLTLSRQTRTLSGGEAQRIALANQLGANLVGTLYVLDEPTIGLHARDTATLAGILRDLATAGNTVVVVEHDPEVMRAADYLVEMGPLSGAHGGEIVCAAPHAAFLEHPTSLTARYLRGDLTLPRPRQRRRGNGRALIVAGACEHNLKNLTVRVPLGMLIGVTGVSGSGKSTLVEETLYRAVARAFRIASLPMGRFTAIKGLEHLDGVRLIDQEPIGRTPRSNPVTYLKAFDGIRRLFAAEPAAWRKGLTAAHFSFNTKGGRCEHCQGTGAQKLEMYFFEDLYVVCEHCAGRRFNATVLSVRYRGHSVADVLDLTVSEALQLFGDSPRVAEPFHGLASIGLGYLRLGQPATTLSGGEAQRLKIAAELAARPSGHVLYILDEPTTGLHADDIRKLLALFHKLVDAGHTVIVVEHNLDVIQAADWLLDLGPEGGEAGGWLVAEGTPEQVALVPGSHTGRFLARRLACPS